MIAIHVLFIIVVLVIGKVTIELEKSVMMTMGYCFALFIHIVCLKIMED